jgi:hypothetical protein
VADLILTMDLSPTYKNVLKMSVILALSFIALYTKSCDTWPQVVQALQACLLLQLPPEPGAKAFGRQ